MYCRFAVIGVGHEIQYPMRATSSIDNEGDGKEEELTGEMGDEEEEEDNLEESDDDMSDEEDFRF